MTIAWRVLLAQGTGCVFWLCTRASGSFLLTDTERQHHFRSAMGVAEGE